MSLQVQMWSMFLMIASGGLLGAVFDIYRVVAGQVRPHRIIVSALDVLYWIAATIVVFRVLYTANSGEVRLFVFLGLLLGISIYFALISTYVIRAVRVVIRALQIAASWCVRMFRVLVIRPLLFMYRLLKAFLGFLAVFSMFLFKIVLQLLYPVWLLLKWATRPIHKYLHVLTRWKRYAAHFSNWIKRLTRRTK